MTPGISNECTSDLLSPEMRKFASLAAQTSDPVLLLGETGSGKTYLAKRIHQLGPRSGKPFVPVNCAAVAESLFESEMFGHMQGAFTGATRSRPGLFEMADDGTLFLDEVGELPLDMQPKLLRVLEAGCVRRVGAERSTRVDVRVIAATNRDLWEMVERKEFREDLYYRCAVLERHVPPLRERRGELPRVIRHLLERNATAGSPPEISAEAWKMLLAYDWPGNLRELNNALHRAEVLADKGIIEPHHLPERVRAARVRTSGASTAHENERTRRHYTAPDDPEEEQRVIRDALRATGGNKTHAADRLGMVRSTLWAKLKQYAIE